MSITVCAASDRRLSRAVVRFGTSLLALAASTSVWAQCTPDVPPFGGQVICTGEDGDGLTVRSDFVRISVAEDAIIAPRADGAGAVVLQYDGGRGMAFLNNAGRILSDRGAAIAMSGDSGLQVFSRITNAAGASIVGSNGGVNALVGRLDNAGVIDGGAGSAYGFASSGGAILFPSSLINSGVIRNDSSIATIALGFGSFQQIGNSGQIINLGSGAVYDSRGESLNLHNQAGGVISTAGAIALRSDFQVTIRNDGTINGSVIGGNGFDDYIDTSLGTINGDVLLNEGSDILVAALGSDRLVGNISGTIDGGAGTDIIALQVSRDSIMTQSVLPTGFERLQLDLADNAVVTLATSQSPAGGYAVRGIGTVVMGADIAQNGPILTGSAIQNNYGDETLNFVNSRSLVATLSDNFEAAVSFGMLNSVVNSGLIRGVGGRGAIFGIYSDGVATNDGTIEADFIALTMVGSLINNGFIRSTGDVALANDLGGGAGRGRTSINNGLIEGNKAGARLSSMVLVNNGTIVASHGAGVALDWSATVDNRAGGVIGGSGVAISGGSESIVLNAGTINGDVDFRTPYTYSRDIFVDRGGTVNGNVWLGGGDDVYVTQFGRGLAGATGQVDPGEGRDTLILQVSSDLTTDLTTGGSFEVLGYELENGAALSIGAAGQGAASAQFSGVGTVDFSADLNSAGDALLTVGAPSLARLLDPTVTATGLLSVVNRGSLNWTAGSTSFSAIVLSGPSGYSYWPDDRDIRFENAGTITATGNPAISGSATVINSGVIQISDGVAITGSADVTNSGIIRQIAGGGGSRGIAATGTVLNSGTIDTDGTAITIASSGQQATLVNSGLVRSAHGPAVMGGFNYPSLDNQAGGRIEGGSGGVAISFEVSGTVNNAGTIVGDINFASQPYYSVSSSYAGDGIVDGNVLFGGGNDIFLQLGDETGVTGRVDAGEGTDLFARIYRSDATVALGSQLSRSFELDYLGAASGATVTIDAASTSANTVFVGGEGSVINLATLDQMVTSDVFNYFYGIRPFDLPYELGSFVNRGTLTGGISLFTNSLVNDGLIRVRNPGYGSSLGQHANSGSFLFDNRGRIIQSPYGIAVGLSGDGVSDFSANNSGTISGGVSVVAILAADATGKVLVTNSGILRGNPDYALRISNQNFTTVGGGTYSLVNMGLIEGDAQSRSTVDLAFIYGDTQAAVSVINSGTIRASGAGVTQNYSGWWFDDVALTAPSAAMTLLGNGKTTLSLINDANGLIEATGDLSTAIVVGDAAFTLDNSGTIRGGSGTILAENDDYALFSGTRHLAGAIQTVGDQADSITNSGTIIGSIDLGGGDDVVVNRGRIEGNVFLGYGDDSFTQLVSASLIGTVDGGAGTDSFIVDATGGGTINADQFVNFERFAQIGAGNVTYSGNFSFETIGLEGGTVTVAAGETVSSSGPFTISGGAGSETVVNNGTISGGIDLAGGDDSIVNGCVVGGPVWMGAGNDSFTEQAGSRVAGVVDGGSGTDLYRLILFGDRSGTGVHSGFERLGVEGSGRLTLALGSFGYDDITLSGTDLDLTTNGRFVGQLLGSDAREQVRVTGDAALIQLGGGDDALTLDTVRASGRYDGGAGSNSLAFAATGPVTLAGTAIGFDRVALAGGSLIVSGQLGQDGAALAFGDDAQTLEIATGGQLRGLIDMGAGDDSVRLNAGSFWRGTLAGGAGSDRLFLTLPGAFSLDASRLSGVEHLVAQGQQVLTLTGSFTFDSLDVEGDLTIASGAALTTPLVTFGAGDNRFTIDGLFTGSADGGADINRLIVTGGSAATPVRFASISNFAELGMSGGFASVSGVADFGTVALTGGRLHGLSGSTIRARTITVEQAATFGSAGSVVGDINVAGTLSPGASPGTMTVTGNVALAGGSNTLMEITPTVSDQIVISGKLAIASGASLVLSVDQQSRPGTSLDLIIAAGGIAGSFTNVVKPASLFGFIVQQDDRIRLLGQFLDNSAFSPQVGRAIDYVNGQIQADALDDDLLAALPLLVTASGGSNATAFARLTAQPYAAATQLAVESGLTLAEAGRGIARLSSDEAPRAFALGQYLGGLGRLAGDDAAGLSASRGRSYGLLGGFGIGNDRWSVAAFGGYLDGRQTLPDLGAHTDTDGWFAGLGAGYALGALRVDAMLGYYDASADTSRPTPGTTREAGRYRLKSWIGDLSFSYEASLGSEWAVQPKVGVTYVQTRRTVLVEDGGTVWALDVAGDKHHALFADAGLGFGRSRASQAALRPFVRLGLQYQLRGRGVEALAGFDGTGRTFLSQGAGRAGLMGSVTGGGEVRVSNAVSFFATASQSYSEDDRRASASVGLKFAF